MMGRFRHIHLVLMAGISLFVLVFVAYSVYADLSQTVLLPSDMSFEDSDDEDLSTCQTDLQVFLLMPSSNPLLPRTHFGEGPSFFSSRLTSYTQIMPVLRC